MDRLRRIRLTTWLLMTAAAGLCLVGVLLLGVMGTVLRLVPGSGSAGWPGGETLIALAALAIAGVGVVFVAVGRRLVAHITLRHRSIEQAHGLLDMALANMANGLTLWNADGRLVVYNAQACRLLDIDPDRMHTGMTFRQFLRLRHARGAFGDQEFEDSFRQRMEVLARREPQLLEDRWQDGRVVNVLHRPLADGGWIGTYEDVTERHRADARMSFLAHFDALTGLGNRVHFDRQVGEVLARADAAGNPVAVLGIDLDRFKPVNDTLGHGAGDRLLVAVAQRLVSLLRADDVVARLGGDEFAVVVPMALPRPGAGDAPLCILLAERIIDQLSQPFMIDGQPISIGASIGIALFPGDGRTGSELLRCADIAMYRAKQDGRTTYRLFEASMDEDLQSRRSLERDLRRALDDGSLDLFYQPLVCCRTGSTEGFEALLRWSHPVRGPIPPTLFVTLAEEINLIGRLGDWVMETACQAAAAWPPHMRVAVNLSPAQFKQRDLADVILMTLARTGLSPSRLEVEVTEGLLVDDPARAARVLTRLRAAGVRVSLDDFGTGYSSLSYLRQFPLDKIKIDKSFIDTVASDPQSATIVRTLVSLAHTLNLTVTAEGVETAEQLAALQGECCDQVQGYLLGRPQPDRYRRAAPTGASTGTPTEALEAVGD